MAGWQCMGRGTTAVSSRGLRLVAVCGLIDRSLWSSRASLLASTTVAHRGGRRQATESYRAAKVCASARGVRGGLRGRGRGLCHLPLLLGSLHVGWVVQIVWAWGVAGGMHVMAMLFPGEVPEPSAGRRATGRVCHRMCVVSWVTGWWVCGVRGGRDAGCVDAQ